MLIIFNYVNVNKLGLKNCMCRKNLQRSSSFLTKTYVNFCKSKSSLVFKTIFSAIINLFISEIINHLTFCWEVITFCNIVIEIRGFALM
jgi:hypothetical protein